MTSRASRPTDWRTRDRALNSSESFIIQAPAGSGKTELLIQRILVLLARVERPEEVLAITFTRKAAGEMRNRLLESLLAAKYESDPEEDHAYITRRLACLVLERDHLYGWHLLENPNRLQIKTIDSLCASIVRKMPWLSRFGTIPETTDHPKLLYRAAAERIIEQIECTGPATFATRSLLRHLDNRLDMLRDMLVDMLGRRDQWLRHLLNCNGPDARQVLETSLQAYILNRLDATFQTFGKALRDELVTLISFAAENLANSNLEHLATPWLGRKSFPLPTLADFPAWETLCELVLTRQNKLRNTVNRNQGFPIGNDLSSKMKRRMLMVLGTIGSNPLLVHQLEEIRYLPRQSYPEPQWEILGHLVELLPIAVVELQTVFREFGQVDFIEIAGAARAALGQVDCPEELLLQFDSQVKHLLVDEFQDTSFGQLALLEQLTGGWSSGDGRTLFLVGDPMQSIYRFREADVGLYLRTWRVGLQNVRLEPLSLEANFRSQAKIVNWVNKSFDLLFPASPDEVSGAVPYNGSQASRPPLRGKTVSIKLYSDRNDQREAKDVISLVKSCQKNQPNSTTAILVRSRTHLLTIVKALKQAGLLYQAQDIDLLGDRPVVQDLYALTRAILHLGDRVAWLAILRAPWCGLTLDDLLLICSDKSVVTWDLIQKTLHGSKLFFEISDDGRQRLDKFCQIMQRTLRLKGRLPLHRLVESTWLALGGAACVDSLGLEDAEQYLRLLAELENGGDLERFDVLDERLNQLFAASNPDAGADLQVMTIHKAKGLEFDNVILPGLGRSPRLDEKTLLRWQELPDGHLLLAPVPAFDSQGEDRTYASIGRLMREKENLEKLRLFYVAVTRAKSRLYLLGHTQFKSDGTLYASRGSLLEAGWPAIKDQNYEFVHIEKKQSENHGGQVQSYSRLPVGWSPGTLAKPAISRGSRSRAATSVQNEDFGNETRISLNSEEDKVVGKVTHLWLERMAVQGHMQWTINKVRGLEAKIRTMLIRHGISAKQIARSTNKVLKALENTLRSDTGCWLLASHKASESELPLSGVVDGELIHATLDRTFLTDEGVRWIVDFKISEPRSGESREAFISREVKRYAGQLEIYAKLFRKLEPHNKMRTALYFPLLDVIEEVAVLYD